MKEILESKVFVGFMLLCMGCMYFVTPEGVEENTLVQGDSNTISVSDYAYI